MSQKPAPKPDTEESSSTESEQSDTTVPDFDVVSSDDPKMDAKKFVTGDVKYTADYEYEFQDIASGKIVRSEIAHGYVKAMDTSSAEEMDGVYAVLTPWSEEIPDEKYTSAGQSYMEPSPYDMKALREKVRYVGDPIAAVAAKDQETADRAARQINVEYKELEPLLDFEKAMDEDAPQLFDPEEVENKQPGADYDQNLEMHLEGEIGDVEAAFEEAEERDDMVVIEDKYETQYQSHGLPEVHTTIIYRNEDNRYHVITSTQVPNHIRRMLAQLYDVAIGDIRVTKPPIGSGFGGKQTLLLEPVAWALHEAAERPVKIEVSRREEFQAMRFRREAAVKVKTAATTDGEIVATDFQALGNSGAYGPHGLTVTGAIGTKPLPMYPGMPNVRFEADAVHTNKPVPGAQRGYGNPQGTWALESHLDEVAHAIDMDPLEIREKNHAREGDVDEISAITGGEGSKQIIQSCGFAEAIEKGKNAIGYDEIEQPAEDHLSRGIGMALTKQGSGVAGDELSAAQIKMNEDGTFILLTGAVDIGSGAVSTMARIAAEELGVAAADIVVESADTDVTPHDYGTYASSTTYISGNAVQKAAKDAKETIKSWARKLMGAPEGNLILEDCAVVNEGTGNSVTLEEIGYESIYGEAEREHIMGQGSFSTDISPSPYGAQFVDVTVNEKNGEYDINKLVQALDIGTAIDPGMVEGQIEGAEMMALEYATRELLTFDDEGNPEVQGYRDYGMPRASEMPPMETILVEPHDPTGPFGAKSAGEVPTNPLPPALANAIRDAVGVRITDLPITAEAIKEKLDAA
ncbi:xanthine dehydrogenase family protein molybdopterin-binding subunit [Halodesulfurarchaeum sp.]|uniref:xanthine dehydrogenase family protein molybdopterin-binding subunit n=1 Tax=Halodesulfurarchaeum sp. TaxID=1980530 RepID=UPI002FC3D9DA